MPAAEFDDLWVVLPVFNEAPMLAATLSGLTETFGHVCVVDDCSSDDSAQIAEGFRDQGVRLLRHSFNIGQGAALQTGIEYALRDPEMMRLVTFNANGQHSVPDAAAMARLLDPTQNPELDVVLASRFLDGTRPAGFLQRRQLKLAVAFTKAAVGIKLTDNHNGLMAFSRWAAEHIHLKQNGMAHATEILEQIMAMKANYAEYPSQITNSSYSKYKRQSLLNSINNLVDLILR